MSSKSFKQFNPDTIIFNTVHIKVSMKSVQFKDEYLDNCHFSIALGTVISDELIKGREPYCSRWPVFATIPCDIGLFYITMVTRKTVRALSDKTGRTLGDMIASFQSPENT